MPDGIALHDMETAWHLWRLMCWTDWRWPPDVLLRQDYKIIEDLATIQWYSDVVKDAMVGPVGSVSVPISG